MAWTKKDFPWFRLAGHISCTFDILQQDVMHRLRRTIHACIRQMFWDE